MRKHYCAVAVLCLALGGCSTVQTRKVSQLDDAPKGIRVFPPAVYLFVEGGANAQTTIAYMPDYKRAYDVKPLTIFAKQDFKIEIEDGQIKSLLANQDTTAFLTFLKEAGTAAAKGAGVGLSASSVKGSFGLQPGIYRLNVSGVFEKVGGQ